MSWIPVEADNLFPIQSLPFGVFSIASSSRKRIGVALGDYIVDLSVLSEEGLLEGLGFDAANVLGQTELNAFMGLTRDCWRAARSRLTDLLASGGCDDRLRSNEELRKLALVPIAEATMHLPARIGDYTDFYSSREHATNVGTMLRGAANALQPNWLHLPVGYHGRSSSVVISGTDFHRPCGQVLLSSSPSGTPTPHFSPSKQLDYELEMAFFVGGPPNPLGIPISISEAEDRIFGVVLMNDWSARDIQSWEYVPLGPFTSKSFCTSISPWIVSLDALEGCRCCPSSGPQQLSPEPLQYLRDPEYQRSAYDIHLEVAILPEGEATPSIVGRSNAKYLYWNMKQQLVHHSITGCPMIPGDLLGSGTISGPQDVVSGTISCPQDVVSGTISGPQDQAGCLLEATWRGTRPVTLSDSATGAKRTFLEDGDTVIMSGYAVNAEEGYRIGFGNLAGTVLPPHNLIF